MRRSHPLAFLMVAVVLVACGGEEVKDEQTLTPETLPGRYKAVEFRGGGEDVLTQGASIELTLHEDRTTSGRLFVPSGGEDGGDFDADLTGTWAVSGKTVTLAHGADTFLRDLPLTIQGRQLIGSLTSGGLRVVLEQY